uniref:Glycosyl transferase, family 2 n=1 Tax=Solibacter usitatus (strain Ellin6076) TaxID=234267 RepID=Q01XL1_SOLUE
MLVSILIPCYNAEPWIGEAIRSALDQDYANKEVIVVDDGSTDGSLEVIRGFGDRITFQPGPHAGANAARNRLTDLARGEWLQYLDADDYLLPQKLTSQVQMLGDAQGIVDVICSPVICHTINSGADRVLAINHADAALNFINWGMLQTTGLLFRRTAVLEVGGWKNDQPCCQEHELLLRLLVAGGRFITGSIPASVYRVHSEGTVSRRDPLRVIRIRMELTNRLVQYLDTIGNLTSAHRSALFVARMEAARSAYAKGDQQLAAQLYEKACEVRVEWPRGLAALPFSYRCALQILGFKRAEQLASLQRRWRSFGSPSFSQSQ